MDRGGGHREKLARCEIYLEDLGFEIYPVKTGWEIGNKGQGKGMDQD